MGSSNRHWPSLFKSNPSRAAAAAHHHIHHDTSHFSNHCHKPNAYSDEKSPEPKPRWNPKPEQIRILESIFNSGLVNPPRDQIRRIRDQLQVYGHVGDANVFYWFQNRKSRSKLKLRHLKSTSAPKSSASTSSERTFQTPFPSQTLSEAPVLAPGDESCGIEAGMSYLGMLALLGSFTDADFANAASTLAFGNAMEAAPKSTIFINEIAYEVTEMPINIREAFGENTILVHSSGHPVLTDEWGLTLHPLQHGSSYYLV